MVWHAGRHDLLRYTKTTARDVRTAMHSYSNIPSDGFTHCALLPTPCAAYTVYMMMHPADLHFRRQALQLRLHARYVSRQVRQKHVTPQHPPQQHLHSLQLQHGCMYDVSLPVSWYVLMRFVTSLMSGSMRFLNVPSLLNTSFPLAFTSNDCHRPVVASTVTPGNVAAIAASRSCTSGR